MGKEGMREVLGLGGGVSHEVTADQVAAEPLSSQTTCEAAFVGGDDHAFVSRRREVTQPPAARATHK